MAGLQSRNGSWRVIFWYKKKQHTFWIGEVEEHEATRPFPPRSITG